MHNKDLAKEYLYINQVKETVELTNVVKISSLSIFNKNRFCVLTSHRLLIFEDKEAYLLKKASKEFFEIRSHDFDLNKTDLIITTLKDNDKKLKVNNENLNDNFIVETIKFPSIELCNQWWETIKFFKAKIRKEEEEKELKLDGILKCKIHKGNYLRSKNSTINSKHEYINLTNNRETLEKCYTRTNAIDKVTHDIDKKMVKKILKKTSASSIKKCNQGEYNKSSQAKKFCPKSKLNNSYDDRINFKSHLYNLNQKDKDSRHEYLTRIKAYFKNNQYKDGDNFKKKNIGNRNQLNNIKKNETISNDILNTHSYIHPTPNKYNPFFISGQSYDEKSEDKNYKINNSPGQTIKESFEKSKFNENPSTMILIQGLNEKRSLQLKINDIANKNINLSKKSENNISNQKLKNINGNLTKFKYTEDVKNKKGLGNIAKSEKESDNINQLYNYNDTKYKEIPPNSKLQNQEYFKSFISNNVGNKKNHSGIKGQTKKKMTRTHFEILSKSFAASQNEQETNPNEFLYDNQNKLKNKISYKLKPIDTSICNNQLRHQSISFIHSILSDENLSQTDFSQRELIDSDIKENNYSHANETLKIKQPIGSLTLNNKLGEGFEENCINIRKLNNKIKNQDNKILNSNDIKSKIDKLGLVKDFEDIQCILNLNSFNPISNSHDNHKILEAVNKEKFSPKFKNMEKSDEKLYYQEKDYLKKVTLGSRDEGSKRNLIILKLLRENNNKSADFALSKENREINPKRSTDNHKMPHDVKEVCNQERYDINFINWKNLLLNNPEKDQKIQKLVLKKKESQSTLEIRKDSIKVKHNFDDKKYSKNANGSQKKIISNNTIVEENIKKHKTKKSNLRIDNNENAHENFDSLILRKNTITTQKIDKDNNDLLCKSTYQLVRDHELNDLDSKLNSNGKYSLNNLYQTGGTKNLINLNSKQFCFYCFRGHTEIASNSSHLSNKTHDISSPNSKQISFSNYLNFINLNNEIESNHQVNNKVFNEKKINRLKEENYSLNEHYNNYLLQYKKNSSLSENENVDQKEKGIRDFYNKKKQQNCSFNNNSHQLSTNNKSKYTNSNNTLYSIEENIMNNIQKDFYNSKISKNISRSFNFLEGNEKQQDEIFNCDSVISFSKKYHIQNEFKNSLPCNYCWQYLENHYKKSENKGNICLENQRKNYSNTIKQKDILLVRDTNNDKNDFIYQKKRMDIQKLK